MATEFLFFRQCFFSRFGFPSPSHFLKPLGHAPYTSNLFQQFISSVLILIKAGLYVSSALFTAID
jgi:hypothetical protein